MIVCIFDGGELKFKWFRAVPGQAAERCYRCVKCNRNFTLVEGKAAEEGEG